MSTIKSFFITKKIPEHFFKSITNGCQNNRCQISIEMWQHEHTIPRDELFKRIAGKTGILCTLADRIDGQLLDAAGPQLKVVSTLSVGYDHIDLKECSKRGIVVGNTPDVLTDAVSELTVALTLATLRRFTEATQSLREGKWQPGWGHFYMCGSMVKNSVIGMIGAGRIGQGIMSRLNAFKPAQFLYTTRNRKENIEKEFNAIYCSLEDLLKQSDIVIICCSLNESTRQLLKEPHFKLMKPNSILVNTARGLIVDQKALYDALKSRTIAAAGLDVFETEPIPTNDPLLELDNVVLLPHIGSAALSTREEMLRQALENVLAGIEGRPLLASVSL